VERADLVEALWRHHGVRRTVVVTFDYTSLALLELWRRQLEQATSREGARPAIQPMSFQTMALSWSIVSMPYCSFGFPVVSTAIR
jgi:hypothetical protein